MFMNDASRKSTSADLPRPRQTPSNPYHFESSLPTLPPLPSEKPMRTQEFSIPKQYRKTSDELPTQKLPAVPEQAQTSSPKKKTQTSQKKNTAPKKNQQTVSKPAPKKQTAPKPKPKSKPKTKAKKKKASHHASLGGVLIKKIISRIL
jgi:hypothetical protein